MKMIAVVTGASSGLGSEFARQIDALGEVNQIWLIARRRERLEEVAAQLRAQARVLSADLSTREGISEVARSLAQANEAAAVSGEGGVFVRYLVNAAGFGKIGSYRDIPLEEVDRMIDLNCRGAVDMTQIILPYCARGSRVLEICSTAGFQPFQYLNVYAASKSFLYRYSRALNMELLREGTGITVTAVCPYWVTDTEFISGAESTADIRTVSGKPVSRTDGIQTDAQTDSQADMNLKQGNEDQPGKTDRSEKGAKPSYGNRFIRHYPLSTKKETVVAHALADASLGLSVSTPGLVCTVHRFFAKILSSNVLMWCWELIRRS